MTPTFLKRYYEETDDEISRLALVARRMTGKEQFNEKNFRAELITSLKQATYEPPHQRAVETKKSFYATLRDAGVMHRLISHQILLKLWYCTLIPTIIKEDKELENNRLTVDRRPLNFHQKMADELYRHWIALTYLTNGQNRDEGMDAYLDAVAKQMQPHYRIILQSKYQGSRTKLISVGKDARNEEKFAMAESFQILKKMLPSRKPSKNGVSDRFLHQLAAVIVKGPNAASVPLGDALRKFIEYRR